MRKPYFALLAALACTPAQASFDGDVDGSGLVDFNDIIAASIAFTGPGGTAALPGDTDGDGDVDDEDMMVIISGQTAFQGPGPGFAYELIYDPSDGTLTIDTKGGTINGYALKSGAFSGGSHTPFILGTSSSLGDVLSESNPFGGVSGTFDLGAVLSPGLDESGFADSVVSSNYTTGLGQPIDSFELVYVPEPASALLLLGPALVISSRRRRI